MSLSKPTIRGSLEYIGDNVPHPPVKRGLIRINGRKASVVSLETGGERGNRDIDTLRDVEVVEEANGVRITGTSLWMIAELKQSPANARVEIFVDPTGKCRNCS